MGTKYKVYTDKNLLVDVLYGDVTLTNIIELYQKEHENVNFFKINRSLSDIREAKIKLSAKEVKDFIQFAQNPNDNKDFRWAIIANNPLQTALSFMVIMDKHFKDVIKVFSTLKAANNYLATDYSEPEFNDNDFIEVN